MTNRCDLEQNIMHCWNITDDIELLIDSWDKLDEDGKQNVLIGFKQIYQLKFEKLWDIFEKCIHNKEI